MLEDISVVLLLGPDIQRYPSNISCCSFRKVGTYPNYSLSTNPEIVYSSVLHVLRASDTYLCGDLITDLQSHKTSTPVQILSTHTNLTWKCKN